MIVDPTAPSARSANGPTRRASGRSPSLRSGTPAAPARRSATAWTTCSAARVDGPWCYMEFGNVGWCRDPVAARPAAARGGARDRRDELAQVGCHASARRRDLRAVQERRRRALEHSARAAARRADQRSAVPRAARQRAGAQLDQRTGLAAATSLPAAAKRPTAAARPPRRRSSAPTAGTWSRVVGLLLIVGRRCSACCCCSASSRSPARRRRS